MTNSNATAPLLTVKDVMERLKVSRQMIWDLRKSRKLTAVQINDSVRFTEAEIERFIRESTETPAA